MFVDSNQLTPNQKSLRVTRLLRQILACLEKPFALRYV
jgi:hypothetical protein